jgi:hypothetical protein
LPNVAVKEADIRSKMMETTITLSDEAIATAETIRRTGETLSETINRILEALLPTAADFDHFYGEPRDGLGPSGV